MFGQSSQTTGIFGNSATAAPATTTPGGFGHQRNTASLFTPATGTTSTAPFSFNASAPTTSAPASATSLFGSTATNANQGTSFSFGTTTTQQPQQQQQQSQTQSLFGSAANKTNQGTSFSFGNATTQTQQPQQQKALFGTNTTTTQQQPSLFGATQQQQQQQQQGSSLLSLQAAFPDTNVPYFTIRPDGINRTTFPSNFFLGESSSSSTSPDSKTTSTNTFTYKGKETTISASNSDQQKDNSSLRRTFSSSAPSSSHPFGDKRTVLPGFLTGTPAQTSENATTGQKRFIDSNDSSNRRVLFKSTSSPASSSGIFGGQHDESYAGFGKYKPTDINLDQPPVSSLWDIGVNPKPAIMSANLNDMKKNITMASGMNEHGIKNGTSTSVCIFGFPTNLTTQVLDYFEKCGEIAEKDLSDGNWMTIRYVNEEGAKKALENNGKIVEGNFMVGVTPLITTATITGSDNKNYSNNTTTSASSTSIRSGPVILAQPAQGVFKTNDNPTKFTLGLFKMSSSSSSSTTALSSSSLPPPPSLSSSSSLFQASTPISSSTSTTSSEFTNARGQQVTKVVDDSYASRIRNYLPF